MRIDQRALALVALGMMACTESTSLDASFETDTLQAERRRSSQLRDHLEDHGVEAIEAPLTPSSALFELGQALAFDPVLSGNRNIACLTCHHPTVSSGDARALPAGEGGIGIGQDRVGGHVIPRNAPELFNRHAMDEMFWDGRVSPDGSGGFDTPAGSQLTPEMAEVFTYGALAAQAMFPVTSREEMRGFPGESELGDLANDDFTGIWAGLMARLGDIPEYTEMFEAAYPGESFEDLSFAHAANAIAAFEAEGFQSLDSPLQQFLDGDNHALSNHEVKGGIAFFDAGCGTCHSGPLLSDLDYHNTGVAQFGPGKGDGPDGHDDFGRSRVTGDDDDRYAFRTPTLFNVELTAPYGHLGQFGELDAFVDHYLDPAGRLADYDIVENCIDPNLHTTQVDNLAGVLATLSPDATADISGGHHGHHGHHGHDDGERFVSKVLPFLAAMTDPSARDLLHLVPESVPSGLPLD